MHNAFSPINVPYKYRGNFFTIPESALRSQLDQSGFFKAYIPEVEKGKGSESAIMQIEDFIRYLTQELGVEITDHNDLITYLLQYPEIKDAIAIASKSARNFWGSEAVLKLYMFYDPEEEVQFPILEVRLKEYPEDMMDIIEKIESEYSQILKDSEGWFLLTTDFVVTDVSQRI